MQRNNFYDGIAEFYDRIALGGYCDYKKAISSLEKILGDKKDVLEVSIGTAIIGIELAKLGYRVEGVDCSRAMIEIARKKIIEQNLNLPIYEQNIMEMDTGKTYDAIISHGGFIWHIKDKPLVETYLEDIWEVAKALKRVNMHLRDNGVFAVNIHQEHDQELVLPIGDGLFYRQSLVWLGEDSFTKNYYVLHVQLADKVIASESSEKVRFQEKDINELYKSAGFRLPKKDEDGLFLTLIKI
ncbi:MAG: class I SAM-dependent methyltransferase [Candidatus Woesearchaeota archaeon]